ncbi:MAG: alpha/beta hydrolase [Gemmatimonadales bacterium]
MALTVLGLIYAAALIWLRLNEDRLIYFPNRAGRQLEAPSAGLALGAERVLISTPDSVRLAGWVIPARPPDSTGLWLLLFHGNAGDISSAGRPEHDRQLRDLGLDVLAIDYRGYGESEGTPSEEGLYTDARAAYDYLRTTRGVPPSRIVLYGHSLGSAVAIDLATRVEVAGLIVEGAFTSVPDRGQEIYPFFPVRLIARSRFASLDKIGRIAIPKLFIHGRDDITIPIRHGRRLYDRAQSPKTFLEVRGGHDDAYAVDSAAYQAGISRFLGLLVSPGR